MSQHLYEEHGRDLLVEWLMLFWMYRNKIFIKA